MLVFLVHVPRTPGTVTRCNRLICRRYGALWAYFTATSVGIEAPPGGVYKYSWKRRVRSYFRCKRCGCVRHYKYRKKGRDPVAVNATNFRDKGRDMSQYAVVDPATGDVVQEYPTATDEQMEQALAAAAKAHREWSRRATVAERAALIKRVANHYPIF